MNKTYILFLAISLFCSINCFSQITYVDGYYINNSNQKIDCLIKNVDWKNNPLEFDYKPTEQADKKTITIKSVKEFGINDVSKYIRAEVNIDRSSNNINLLSNDKNPVFKQEQLFLKVLIEGEASLFVYSDKSLRRYFFKTPTKDIEQLVYKEYKTTDKIIRENIQFRNQLYANLKCNDITIDDVKNIDYRQKEIARFLTKYNTCKNATFVNFEEKVKSDKFHLNIRPGINSSSLSISNGDGNSRNIDYNQELSFRIGLEFEYIMGFNKNKWAILFEPTYQYYKSDKEIINMSNTEADYQSIELPVGIRHYLFLSEKSKFFINGSFVADIALKSKVRSLDVASGQNLAFGLGYNYNNLFSVEFRYYTSRDVLTEYVTWSSKYKTTSLIFGYTIF